MVVIEFQYSNKEFRTKSISACVPPSSIIIVHLWYQKSISNINVIQQSGQVRYWSSYQLLNTLLGRWGPIGFLTGVNFCTVGEISSWIFPPFWILPQDFSSQKFLLLWGPPPVLDSFYSVLVVGGEPLGQILRSRTLFCCFSFWISFFSHSLL